MRKSLIALISLAAAAAAPAIAETYKVIAPMPPEAEGTLARIMSFGSGAIIDSVLVKDKAARFKGQIDEPVLAVVQFGSSSSNPFILEPGTLSFNDRGEGAFGSMLNDQLRDIVRQYRALHEQFGTAADDAARSAVMARYTALTDSVVNANTDNPLGYYIFISGNNINAMSSAELEAAFKKYPYFAGYQYSDMLLDNVRKREATQPGHKFVDFSITQPDGTVRSLSDYAGKGKYVLVDFWASWCGPCIRQTKVLKQIQEKYKDDPRLQILGVAVWDKVEDTRRAISQHGLTWDCIVDAQSVPTDLYAITGIPCIMLIGPDGTILSRDKQGDELIADVDAALQAK